MKQRETQKQIKHRLTTYREETTDQDRIDHIYKFHMIKAKNNSQTKSNRRNGARSTPTEEMQRNGELNELERQGH
jgi:hypothetical protein